MEFGLGLVLSLTDNASERLESVISTLDRLQNTSRSTHDGIQSLATAFSSLSHVGAELSATITAPIGAFMRTITTMGVARAAFVENMDLAFTALMADAKSASEYLAKLMNFAKTTPYTYESITEAAQVLLTYGMQENVILDETNGKFSGILQALGDWAGATGKGQQGLIEVAEVLGRISSEGKVSGIRLLQLQRRGINATRIIGNMYNVAESGANELIKSMDSSQFIQDLVKGIEEGTDGINGATGKFADSMSKYKQTWMGAKDTFVSSLKNAGLQLMGEYIDEMGVTRYKFLETLTESLNSVSKAIKMIPSILQPIMDLIQTSIKRGSQMILNIATAWSKLSDKTKKGLSVILSILTLMGPVLLIIGKAGGGILRLVRNLNISLFRLLPTFSKLAFAIGLLYLTWRSDFLGIRTNVTAFCEGVKKSFETAQKGVNGSVEDLKVVLAGLDKNDFFDGLTWGIMSVMILMRALSEGWSNYTLSEDTFLKAKELGILPLIEAIFDLKYRFENFIIGFKKGWKKAHQEIQEFVKGLKIKLKGTIFEQALEKLTEFLQALSGNDAESWQKLGEFFGEFAYKALIVGTALFFVYKMFKLVIGVVSVLLTLIKGVVTVFSGIIKFFNTIVTIITTVASSIGHIISDVIGFFQLVAENGLAETMSGLFGGVATTIAGISSIVVGAIIAISSFIDMLINGFSWLKEALMVVGITLAAIGAVILGVPVAIAAAIAAAVAAVATAVVLVVQYWDELVQFFSDTWTAITTALEPVGEFFGKMWDSIVSGITTIIQPAWNSLVSMWNDLVETVTFCKDKIVEFAEHIWETLQETWDNIMSYIQPLIDDFNSLMETLKEFIDFISTNWVEGMKIIGEFFVNLWNFIEPFVSLIWNAFVGLWSSIFNTVYPILSALWNAICGIFMSIFDSVVTILSGIWDFIVSIFNATVDYVLGIIQGGWQFISNIFQAIMDLIMGKPQEAFEHLKSALGGLLNVITAPFKALWKVIKGAFQAVWKVVEGIVKAIVGVGKNIVSGLIQGVQAAWNGVVTFFSNIFNGIINFIKGIFGIHSPSSVFAEIGNFLIQGLLNGIKAVWGMITSFFSTVLNGLKDFIVGIFNGIKNMIVNIWNAIYSFFSTIVNGIWNIITSVFNAIKDTITKIVKCIWSVISSIFNSIKNTISTIVNGVWTIIRKIFNSIKSTIESVINAIKTTITNVWDKISETISNVVNGISETIGNTWEGIKKTVSDTVDGISKTLSNTWDTISSSVTLAWDGIKKAMSDAWDGIKGVFDGVGKFFGDVVDAVKKPFKSIADWFSNTFEKAWSGIKTVFTSGGKVFEGIKDAIFNEFKKVVNGIIDGINWVVAQPFNAINGAFSGLRNLNLFGLGKPFGWLPEISVPEIPKLAEGGVLKKGQTGYLEGDGDEAVVPLQKNTEWIDTLATMLDSKLRKVSGGNTLIPTTYLTTNNTNNGSNSVLTLVNNNAENNTLNRAYNTEEVYYNDITYNTDNSQDNYYNTNDYSTRNIQYLTNNNNQEYLTTTTNNKNDYSTRNIQYLTKNTNQEYLTTSTDNNKEEHNTYDYSVTFAMGAIQFNVQNASMQDAQKFAEEIMEIIKRKQELQKMLHYS